MVWKGSREPAGPYIHGRPDLIHFYLRPGFRAWITDPDADGEFALTVESPVYANR